MLKLDLEALGFDELWSIHERLTKILSDRIAAEKLKLEQRLSLLNPADLNDIPGRSYKPRRKYPKVLPKYCNPNSPTETWSGRGKQPRWLVAALKAGQKLENFKISKA
jgi:DNA-binding protein H-NS